MTMNAQNTFPVTANSLAGIGTITPTYNLQLHGTTSFSQTLGGTKQDPGAAYVVLSCFYDNMLEQTYPITLIINRAKLNLFSRRRWH
jgi:hypothetical protein